MCLETEIHVSSFLYFVGIWIKYLYKKYIFGLLELILLMKSAEFIHELVT